MKALILYASAGSGHKKAAEAVWSQFKKQQPNAEIQLLDAADFATPFYKFSYTTLYEFLITHLCFFWALLFFLTNQPILSVLNKNLRFFVDRNNFKRLLTYTIDVQPDIIVSTHFTCSELVIYLKERKKINSKIISIVTDFRAHYFWAKKGADKYIVAVEKTKQDLIRFGIDKTKIDVLYIPIRKEFFEQQDRNYLKKKYAISDNFTALIMTGAIGVGPIEDIVNSLHKYINIIVVCGNNKILFDKLVSKKYSSVKVLGFVDNVYEWMSISDILITKAGGLTISEATIKLLPMIFFFIVPGQEKNNALFIQNSGAGIICKNTQLIKEFVLELKNSPEKLSAMRENIKKLKKYKGADFVEYMTDEK